MVRGRLIFCVTMIGICSAGTVLATDQMSNGFQTLNSTFAPAVFSSQSNGYQINGSIDAIVGNLTSGHFSIVSGVPLGAVAAAAAGSGGGGLSGNLYNNQTGTGYATGTGAPPLVGNRILPAPSLTFRTPTFKSHQLIGGTRSAAETIIIVNGSSNGVTFPSPNRWQLDLPLFLGFNSIVLQAKDSSGNTSPIIGGQLQRLLIGDVNTDHVVDDRDLSLFTRAWKKYTPFADFNEDGLVNDVDLSLLASHWGMSY